MAATLNDNTNAASSADAPPRQVPVHRRRIRRPDQNRPLEILSILVLYILAVHFALKFASFFLPEDEHNNISREEMLGLRGANGVLGFSMRAVSLPKRRRANASSDTLLQALEDTKINKAEGANRNIQHNKHQRIPILSYQSNYVIVNKPTDMSMHHNSNSRWGRAKGPVLEKAIHKQLARKPYLVHRLDHRTSGACILGFDSSTTGELHGRLRDDDATKLYIALVRGDLREKFQRASEFTSGGLDMSANGDKSMIGSHGKWPDIMIGDDEKEHSTHNSAEHNGKITVNLPINVDGVKKEAQTDFYFLSSIDTEDNEEDSNIRESPSISAKVPYITKSSTLLLCHPRTGRHHQIRRHARAAFTAPIIGDSEHGDSRVNRYWRTTIGLDRLGLHCWYIGLPPSSSDDDRGSRIDCMAPLTTEFLSALQNEKIWSLWQEATRIQPLLKMEQYDERGGTFGRYYRKRHT